MSLRARLALFPLVALVAGCSSSASDASPDPVAATSTPLVGMCKGTPAADGLRTQRDACTFQKGARVADTIGITDADRKKLPIQHVIVMMKENRSFDHLFGKLKEQGQPDADTFPADFANKDTSGAVVAPFHQTNTCFAADPGHQWTEMHAQSDGGKMDGFVTSAQASTTENAGKDGKFVMGYYEQTELPFYYWLASSFALADRFFPSVLSGTFPNRDMMLCGTADGVRQTGVQFPTVPTIFDSLDTAGVSWGVYSDSSIALETTLGIDWTAAHKGVHSLDEFVAALGDGSLPSVVFVDSKANVEDEHPNADVQLGEQWTRTLYDAVTHSPLWPSTALLLTYDEGGGFFDHVPPPTGRCVPDDNPVDADFTELGVRVPLIVISPWARHAYVSHEVHEHTSITRFIELLFDVPAMTRRDANSDALLDLFDFSCTPDQPLPAAPAAGAGACKKN